MLPKIQRGSLLLNDDFVQAMSYASPAKISSFVLLNLPKWQSAGMYIDAAELGLAAGTIDPNVILPAVFNQYWLNLNAYARQYHASVGYSEDIEDFAEQSFWKCLKRIMPNYDFERIADEVIVAKSGDVLTNSANVDGNLYTEIMLSVNAKLAKQAASLDYSSPAYLQTVNKLPSTSRTTTIDGHALALYDIGKDYYDLAVDECRQASFVDTAQLSFNYNAVLLCYSVGNVEQVAGIYFPNDWNQVSDGWMLPTITKQSDISLGYSLHIKYLAGEQYEFTAANADSGNAMQIYNDWYKVMSNANFQIAELAKTVMQQGEQIDTLRSMHDGGYLTTLTNEVAKLKKQIATTYQGTVSTNKLLELFVAAKQATGKLDLTLLLSDLSESITGRDITVSNAIGAYSAGETILAGTSITEVLAKLLRSASLPSLSQPTGQLKANDTIDTLYIPYDSKDSIALAINFAQGDAGTFTLPAKLSVFEDGLETPFTVQNDEATFNYTPKSAANLIYARCRINYAEGTTVDADGDKVFAGILSLSVRVVPIFNIYVGNLAIVEQVYDLDESKVLADFKLYKSNAIDNVLIGPGPYQVIVMPANVDCPITNAIVAKHSFDIADINYTAYAVQSKYVSIDTTNLI